MRKLLLLAAVVGVFETGSASNGGGILSYRMLLG